MSVKSTFVLVGTLCAAFFLPHLTNAQREVAVDNLTVSVSATGVLPTVGSRYVIVEQKPDDSDVDRATRLRAAYNKAKQMNPAPSADGRVVVIIPPGAYDLGEDGITLDTEFVDIVGQVPARMTKHVNYTLPSGVQFERTVAIEPPPCGLRLYGNGTGVVRQTANNVYIANMIINNTEYCEYTEIYFTCYYPENGLTNVVIEHVYFDHHDSEASMRWYVDYNGVYRDCVAGDNAFGYYGNATGYFEDCVAKWWSFGCYGNASGTFVSCSAESGFAAQGVVSGIFRNCFCPFGGFTGQVSGYFERCYAGENSFYGTLLPTAHFVHCAIPSTAFGGQLGFGNQDDFNFSSSRVELNIPINPKGDLSMGTFTQ